MSQYAEELFTANEDRVRMIGFGSLEQQDSYYNRTKLMFRTVAIAGPVLGLAIGYMAARDEESTNNAKDLRLAAGYEQCVDFIETQLPANSRTISITLLTKQQLDACGISPPGYLEGSDSTFDEKTVSAWDGNMETSFRVTDADVTLAPVEDYKEAIADRKERAGYNYLKVSLETAGVGLIGLLGGVMLTSSLINFDLRRRKKAAIAGMSKTD